MRTEFKVGLIVGIVFIAGGAILWSMNRGEEKNTDLPFDANTNAAPVANVQPVRAETPPPNRDAARPAQPAVRSTPPPSASPSAAPSTPRSATSTPPSSSAPPRTADTTRPPVTERTSAPPATPATTPPATPSRPMVGPTTPPVGDRPTGALVSDNRTPTTPGSVAPPASSGSPVSVPQPRTSTTPPAGSGTTATPSNRVSTATPYTVADGDTLSTIAHNYYGDVKYYTAIVAANPGLNPDRIRLGQVIQLPTKEDVLSGKVTTAAATPPAATRIDSTTPSTTDTARRVQPDSGSTTPTSPATGAPASGATRVYKVAKGETLSNIAKAQLGDVNRWNEIFELNKDKLASPDMVVEGMELKLPAK